MTLLRNGIATRHGEHTCVFARARRLAYWAPICVLFAICVTSGAEVDKGERLAAKLREEFVALGATSIGPEGKAPHPAAWGIVLDAAEGLAHLPAPKEISRLIDKAWFFVGQHKQSELSFHLALAYARRGNIEATINACAGLSETRKINVWNAAIRHGEKRPGLADAAANHAIRVATSNGMQRFAPSWLAEIADALTSIGRTDTALACLHKAELLAKQQQSVCGTIHSCCRVSDSLSTLGQQQRAGALLQFARGRLNACKPGDWGEYPRHTLRNMLGKLAVSEARRGNRHAAFECAERIAPGPLRATVERSCTYGRISAALGRQGDLEGATLAVRRMDRTYHGRGQRAVAVVRLLVQAGKMNAADGLCGAIASPSRTAEARLAMAEGYMDQGKPEKANALVQTLTLRTRAHVFPKATTYDLEDPATWLVLYDFDGIFTCASFTGHERAAVDLYVQSARLYVKMRLGNLAQRLPLQAPKPTSWVFTEVARRLVELGNTDAALAWTNSAVSKRQRIAGLLGIARGFSAERRRQAHQKYANPAER